MSNVATGGKAGIIHAISANPNSVYTIQNNREEVKCLDINPALGFTYRLNLTAAAWEQFLIVSDTSVRNNPTPHIDKHGCEEF